MMTILHSPTLQTLKRHNWAADTTNKCDFEVLQYLDDSTKGFGNVEQISTGKEALRSA